MYLVTSYPSYVNLSTSSVASVTIAVGRDKG